MADIRLALAIGFARPWAYLLALGAALAMAVLLVWGSGLLAHYPTGWVVIADPQEMATLAILSLLFGVLVPLEVTAITKARTMVGVAGGLAGTLTGHPERVVLRTIADTDGVEFRGLLRHRSGDVQPRRAGLPGPARDA